MVNELKQQVNLVGHCAIMEMTHSIYSDTCTDEPHCNESQGTEVFFLLLVDFCYCQYMK